MGWGDDTTPPSSDPFELLFARESASQQIATLKFYAKADGNQEPIRLISVHWGAGNEDRKVDTVYNGATFRGDNQAGQAAHWADGNPFVYRHTYSRTFWAQHSDGATVCVSIQNNWYNLKKVCGRFKRGASGLVELDTSKNNNGWASGWWTGRRQGNLNDPQPEPREITPPN